MSWTNVYASVNCEARKQSTDIGGRGSNNWLRAWFNTDSADGTLDMSVEVSVNGDGLTAKERRRKDGDQRLARFHVTLPVKSRTAVTTLHYGRDNGKDGVPNVILPSGHTLEYALNCIRFAEQFENRPMAELKPTL